MKAYVVLFSLFSMPLLASETRQECVNEATRKYDACMEIAAEILANTQEGITTDRYSQQEGKELREGKCKALFDKDLAVCPKA